MQGGGKEDDSEEMEDNEEGWAGRWGNNGPGKDNPDGREVNDMPDEGGGGSGGDDDGGYSGGGHGRGGDDGGDDNGGDKGGVFGDRGDGKN